MSDNPVRAKSRLAKRSHQPFNQQSTEPGLRRFVAQSHSSFFRRKSLKRINITNLLSTAHMPKSVDVRWLAVGGLCLIMVILIFSQVQPTAIANVALAETYLPLLVPWTIGVFSLSRSVFSWRHSIEITIIATVPLFARLHHLNIPLSAVVVFLGILLLTEVTLLLVKKR